MKIITNPTVTLISSQQFFEPAHLQCEWQGDSSDPERIAEYAGRVCYLSYNNPAKRTTGEYLRNIMMQGHGSVLEHTVFGVLIEGISRTCSHELVRHRAGVAYSQVSQRYVDSSDVGFVLPPAFENDNALITLWEDSCRKDLQLYTAAVQINMERFSHIDDTVLRRKISRESARSVLPNCTETKIVMTANVRAWRHIIEMRAHEAAEREIRRLAIELLLLLNRVAPHMFSDFQPYRAADGSLCARPIYRKV